MNTSFERKACKEEWLTPKWILDRVGPFDLDPCASIVRPWPTAREHYTIADNGLLRPWRGFVWCNPPYGRKASAWLAKLAEHDDGIALIFARTETEWWQEHIFKRAASLLFLGRRLVFCDTQGRPAPNSAGSPSALVAYGHTADRRLRSLTDVGAYVPLNNLPGGVIR